MTQKPLTYADAGVSIAAGNALVKAIAPLARSTARPGANAELGGFGGFFDLKAAGYEDPLLVAANDARRAITTGPAVPQVAIVTIAPAMIPATIVAVSVAESMA